ncbi:MAG: LemA family protein [Candidatus Harrisonbacteria bacterium]|nr:LemA family protein [Candidatus Harrisonbacteria bacterium]
MKKLVAGVVVAMLLVIAGVGVVMAPSIVVTFNKYATLDQNVDAKWSQVENVYQRRYDLIPNLVNAIKGYMKHEHGTFEDVAKARSDAGKVKLDLNAGDLTPENLAKFQEVQGQLSSALSRLMVVMEKYPELKANTQIESLMVQLEGTENRIAVERKNYNDSAQEYNTFRKQFPANAVGFVFGFKVKPYFKMDEEAKKAPKVDL